MFASMISSHVFSLSSKFAVSKTQLPEAIISLANSRNNPASVHVHANSSAETYLNKHKLTRHSFMPIRTEVFAHLKQIFFLRTFLVRAIEKT